MDLNIKYELIYYLNLCQQLFYLQLCSSLYVKYTSLRCHTLLDVIIVFRLLSIQIRKNSHHGSLELNQTCITTNSNF